MSRPVSQSPHGASGHSFVKLPPIITSELDRKFLTNLSECIDNELNRIPQDDLEQRYVLYQDAFNKIIEYVTSYKPILTNIKKEYEETINAIKKGQTEAVFLTGKLKAMASEPSTLRNYRRRADQLEERNSIIKEDNRKLQAKLDTLRKNRLEQEKKEKEILEPTKKELKKDKRLLPGLNLVQSTDLSVLHRELDKLERQVKDMTISFKTRYIPKSRKDELKEGLNGKVIQCDRLHKFSKENRARQERLEIAVQAAQDYNNYKPPHQTVGDAVVWALARVAGEKAAALLEKAEQLAQSGDTDGREGTPSGNSTFEEDDPSKEKEAEMMLDYIEKFNELFEDGRYAEAAVHAANSPKGILRTLATLTKFKEVKLRISGRTPLLSFCEALMSSVPAVGRQPNKSLSLECVKCALDENRLDLLSHWISQDRLTVSVVMAELIQKFCACKMNCECCCQALAENIYTCLGEHRSVVSSLLKQSRIEAALEYSKRSNFTPQDYKNMLRECPNIYLARCLHKQGQQLLPLGVSVQTLLDSSEEPDKGIQLLVDIWTDSPGDLKAMVHRDGPQTRLTQWQYMAQLLADNGYNDIAVQLLAAATVNDVLHRSKALTH